MSRSTTIVLIIFFVLLIDQSSKIWVKTMMEYGEEFKIFGLDWARIHFVENNGMAFGISLSGSYGKLILSFFRLIAVGFLGYYIHTLIKSKASFLITLSFALILAGALGNIIDSAFYGMIFSQSSYHGGYAQLFPEGGGYSSFLYGKVVDMLYFPMFEGHYPEWIPFLGGDSFQFFRPVFNVADMSITIGVFSIILFQLGYFNEDESENEANKEEADHNQPNSENDIQDKEDQLPHVVNTFVDKSEEEE